MTHVVVLLPGVMGSELFLGNELIWPGKASELVLPYKKMAQLMRDDLAVGDLIRSLSISDQYDDLIGDLGTCGFHEAAAPPTLYACPYDWRKDNARSADVLADKIDLALGQHGGQVEISLVAHSMGGLVSRYYLESGGYASRPGFAAVKRLITLGTPHRGSPFALVAAMGLEPRLFLNKSQVRELSSDPKYPALYQLLPPRGEPFAWDAHPEKEYRAIDVYDRAVAADLGLVEANLASAERFHSGLDPARRPPGVRYFFFVGSRQVTMSSASLTRSGNGYHVEKIELEDAGDGTVPIWSSSLTSMQAQPVGGEHGTIYKNATLRRTLAVLLGKAGVLAAAPDSVEVSLRERVAAPDTPQHLALTFGAGVSKVEGELRWERGQFDAAGTFTGYQPLGTAMRISYAGLDAEKLNLRIVAPRFPGVYRLTYTPQGGLAPAGADELFVQRQTAI
jgi:pimeloyl-ACP methyl ester carboxylesterase